MSGGIIMKSSWIVVCILLLFLATVYARGLEGVQPEPIAHYTFDEGSEDVTGNGFDGTFLGDTFVENGFLYLDGVDDAVEIPTIGTFNELTYAMWVYPYVDLEPLQFSGGINTHDWVTGAVHFKLNYGMLNVGICDFGPDVVGTTILYPDEWFHIALTVSETEVALYLDGILEATAEVTELQNLIVGDANIGAWNLDREWTGDMDEVLIYDWALSEEEIVTLANIPPGITDVSDKETNNITETFNLSQNYPNPFNPTTTIAYSLKANGAVRLSVYDMMGKEVAVLVDGLQAAGNHEVQFSGANLTSGIYFYKLQTAAQVITRKMTLVK
jgi:hypothetical protein